MKKHIASTLVVSLLLTFSGGAPAADPIPDPSPAVRPDPAPAIKKIVHHNLGGRTTAPEAPFNMVLIPEGGVVLGLDQETVERLGGGQIETLRVLSATTPRHMVRGVSAFYCDKYEVTNAQWKQFLDATGREPNHLLRTLAWAGGPDGGLSYPEGEENFPVRNLELRDARAYAAWCGKRLPTEVEWMRAASGDDGRRYPWGDNWDPKLCISLDRRTRQPKLIETGSMPDGASPFGVMDMAGSVTEWTVSPYQAYDRFKQLEIKIGKKTQVLDPRFDGRYYVAKGGYYLGNDIGNLLAVRHAVPSDTNLDTLGFRCVKSVEAGRDIFEAATSELRSAYIEEGKWDKPNFYAVEVTEVDSEKRLVLSSDHLVFAPMAGILTSTSKIYRNENPTPAGFLPLAMLSVSRPIEEPNLPAGAYTLVYRHKGGASEMAETAEAPAAPAEEKPEAKKDDKKKEPGDTEGEEQEKEKEKEKTPEEIAQEEAEKRIDEENRKAKERAEAENAEARKELEKIGAVVSAKELVEIPTSKDLVLFLNASDAIVGYVEVEPIEEGGEDPIRVVHVQATGKTEIEFTVRILGTKHPRFRLPIKIRDNPFGG